MRCNLCIAGRGRSTVVARSPTTIAHLKRETLYGTAIFNFSGGLTRVGLWRFVREEFPSHSLEHSGTAGDLFGAPGSHGRQRRRQRVRAGSVGRATALASLVVAILVGIRGVAAAAVAAAHAEYGMAESLGVVGVLGAARLAVHRRRGAQRDRVALGHQVRRQRGGVRRLERVRVLGDNVPIGRGRVRVRGQRVGVARRGGHGAGRQHPLQAVGFAHQDLEDVV
jgi:hypothetical protein